MKTGSEVRALRARKTLMPRVTDFFTDFEKKKSTVLQSIYTSYLLNSCSYQFRRDTEKMVQNVTLVQSYQLQVPKVKTNQCQNV